MAEPNKAIASTLGRSARLSRASRSTRRRSAAPAIPAPAYNRAAEGGGAKRAQPGAKLLDQWRADAEQRGSEQRQQAALQRGQALCGGFQG
jgi:hypothetical protein